MIYKALRLDAFDDGELVRVYGQLSLSQKKYIKNKNEKSARQSLAARALLCRLISEFCAEELTEYITAGENGRPYIEGRNGIFISISHSKDMIAAAVSERPVGIDIEYIRPVSEKLRKRICNEADLNEDEFFKNWTLKEAWLKATDISFSEMLGLDVKKNCKNAEIYTQKQDGYYITVLEIR